MTSRQELQKLSCLRLEEAEALFAAGYYDGCAYLSGYILEFALKAAVCATLKVEEYPEARLKGSFRTHNFDDLRLLGGMEKAFTPANPVRLANWSVASKWRPERRYEAGGTYDRVAAEEILDALRSYPDGALACISSHW